MIAANGFAQGVIDVHSHIITPEFVSSLENEGRLMDEGFPLPKYNVENHLRWMDEAGVICLYPMQSAEDSCQIRILEIYASDESYQQHLKTDHFQKYKQGTLHMVKDLKLPTMKPLDPETMKLIFKKQR